MLIEKPNNPEYCEKLKEILKPISTWGIEVKSFALMDTIEVFMNTLWELYLDYFQFHPEEALICSIGYQDMLASLVPIINKYYMEYHSGVVMSADEYADKWGMGCALRSKVEAFHELFGSFTGKLDDEEIVEFIDERKDILDEGFEKHLERVPKTHWWWFYGFRF